MAKTSTIVFMAVVVALFSLLGETYAADSPAAAPGPASAAPGPASASGTLSPSISAAFLLSLVAFLFGSRSFFQ
ncbi:hypothetical protein FRX31_027094 [Thalictrum thalictroides]|uniref:Arabinogalactan peptide n=1 Tax=Thalictrum thalictroides TaxID=46969 RepID=A0A7J6VG92_THATH|nr:hypothetical protein FRX31_027094 [Thalictrum thalictroides]